MKKEKECWICHRTEKQILKLNGIEYSKKDIKEHEDFVQEITSDISDGGYTDFNVWVCPVCKQIMYQTSNRAIWDEPILKKEYNVEMRGMPPFSVWLTEEKEED